MIRFLHLFALPALLVAQSTLAASAPISVGKLAPQFAYHLIDGQMLTPAQLQGHKYILWIMGTWCPSCQAGSQIAAQHIVDLARKHVAPVEMEAFDNLGGDGPSPASVKSGIGKSANAPYRYWGILNQEQTATIDPKSAMDIFYLVDAHGKVIAQGMAPGAHWNQIEAFINAQP